ncbi:MAG TPA: peptide MFS transporter [Verrucomicrobiales bacterium]|nr:peptide MFS transporter [Verrucomicrobiales bacterium]
MVSLQGHPRGLYVLFFAEMWERFSYYGMRALLILYLTRALGRSDDTANSIYGSYVALVYATPLLGGMLADRILGARRAVIFGGTLMAIGHFAMAFHQLLYLALAFLIVGNGFFKPNISSIVGRLYPAGDRRRDAGFTIFYMGINLGAFLAPIACGFLGEHVGWHYGFALAGVGMVLGLINFVIGQPRFEGIGNPPNLDLLRKKALPFLPMEWLVYLGGFAFVGLAWLLVQSFGTVGVIMNILGGVIGLILVLYVIFRCNSVERHHLTVAVILTVFSVVFWAFFEQAGSSINLFTDRNVDRVVLGWEIPAAAFQSVNAGFIILLAPAFSFMWRWLADRKWEPGVTVKFALGLLQLSLGFAALYLGARLSGSGIVPLFWLVLGYLLHTMGELCLSPVGLSMITRLSPVRIVGFMMGVWFLAASYAQYVGALVAKLANIERTESTTSGAIELPPPSETVMVYADVYGVVTLIALGVGIVLLLLSPLLKRWIHEEHAS